MSLADDLRAIAHAAVSEEGRTQRWTDPQIAEDADELAARRRLRDETDRYPTKAAADEARGEDEHERDLRGF